MNILIFGANWQNRGDESAIRALIDELRKRCPTCQLKIQYNFIKSGFPYKDIELVEGFKRPSRRNILGSLYYYISILSGGKIYAKSNKIESFLKAIDWADLAVYAPGGPSFGDYYKQYYLVDMMLLLQKKHIPYILYAPSVGPFEHNKRYIANRLKGAKRIWFREEISQKYFESLGLSTKSDVTLDSAFQHSIDTLHYEKILIKDYKLNEFMKSHSKIIGITITDLKGHLKYKNKIISRNIADSFKEFIADLIVKEYGIIFIPQIFGFENGDFVYMHEFLIKNCYILSEDYDCYFQQYLISKLYAVVGMRYHSNIFSAKMGTPFISIAYEQKMTGFMKMAGLEEYCFDVKELSFRKLSEKFSLLEKNYDRYQAMLSVRKEEFKRKSYHNTEMLCEVMKEIDKT